MKAQLKYVCFLFFFLAIKDIHAQIKFQRTYGIGLYNEGRSVKQTFDGGYIIAGSESDAGNGSADVYLLKVDSLGNFMWHKTFGGSNIDRGYSVEQLSDSGYAICGYTNSFGNGGYDGYLIRTDKNGDTLWTKTYGGSDWDFLYAMKKTSDGGFVLAGNTYDNISPVSQSWILKLDSVGAIQWSKQFSIPNENSLNGIIQTPEGDFVAIGYLLGGNNNSKDILVTKLNMNGDSVWLHSFGSSGEDWGTSIDLINTGGYIIGATVGNTNTTFQDLYLIKIDTSGTEILHNEFVSSAGDFLTTVHQVNNTGFVVSGYTFGAGNGGGTCDFTFILTDNVGNFSASQSYGTPQFDYSYDLALCSDGGYIIVGKTNGLRPGIESVYIIKTDNFGNTDTTKVIEVNEIDKETVQIDCYPNPVDNKLHIQFNYLNALTNDKPELKILDLSGKIILTRKLPLIPSGINEYNLDVGDLETGLYFLTITSEKLNFQNKISILH